MKSGRASIDSQGFLRCPHCRGKTRTRLLEESWIVNFPVYCPKCKQQFIATVKELNIIKIEPDTQMQSR